MAGQLPAGAQQQMEIKQVKQHTGNDPHLTLVNLTHLYTIFLLLLTLNC